MTSPPSSLPRRKVCRRTLRELFNEGQYVAQAAEGRLDVRHHPRRRPSLTPPERGQPEGTVTELLEYADGQTVVARAFLYRLPSGAVGASGLPDPTWLLTETEVLIADSDPGHWCERCGGPCTAVP